MKFIPGPALIAAWALITLYPSLCASAIARPGSTLTGWLATALIIWVALQAAALTLILALS